MEKVSKVIVITLAIFGWHATCLNFIPIPSTRLSLMHASLCEALMPDNDFIVERCIREGFDAFVDRERFVEAMYFLDNLQTFTKTFIRGYYKYVKHDHEAAMRVKRNSFSEIHSLLMTLPLTGDRGSIVDLSPHHRREVLLLLLSSHVEILHASATNVRVVYTKILLRLMTRWRLNSR